MDLIDYSEYSLDELLEVKRNISPDSPNYPALLAELRNRSSELESARTKDVKLEEETVSIMEYWVQAVGYFQIFAAVVILSLHVIQIFDSGFSFLNSVVVFSFVVLNGAAGYTVIKGKVSYYWISIVNQLLQATSFSIGSVVAKYSGLGGVYLIFEWTESFSLGASINFNPGISYIEYTGRIPEQWFAIDFLAVFFIGVLVSTVLMRNETCK